jgi:hypothetical protein
VNNRRRKHPDVKFWRSSTGSVYIKPIRKTAGRTHMAARAMSL